MKMFGAFIEDLGKKGGVRLYATLDEAVEAGSRWHQPEWQVCEFEIKQVKKFRRNIVECD